MDLWFNRSYDGKLDAIIVLALMTCILGLDYVQVVSFGRQIFNNFLIGKWKSIIIYVIKAYLFQDFYFCM